MQQMTQHITKEELARLQKEQAFERECNMKAASACNLLRQKLAQQEMQKRFNAELWKYKTENGITYQLPLPPFQLSTREQYKEFREKKLAEMGLITTDF